MLYESNAKPPDIQNRTVPKPVQQVSQAVKAPACSCMTGQLQVPNGINSKKPSPLSSIPLRQPPAGQPQNLPAGFANPQSNTQKPVKGWEAFRQSTGQADGPAKTKYIFSPKEPAGTGMDRSAVQQAGTAAAAKRDACPDCGRANSSCDTLSGFVFDGAELNITHKSQIKALAKRITDLGIKTVTATGHTDSSGSGTYNTGLGYRRAQHVISAIMNRMHRIKPYTAQNVFWRTKTKGASCPVSESDPALNRRVEVCLR